MKYFICATDMCCLCPFHELFPTTDLLTNKITFYRCSLVQKSIKNIGEIPEWCPLPDENDLIVKKFKEICYEKSK